MGDSRRYAAESREREDAEKRLRFEQSPEGRLKKAREQYLTSVQPLMDILGKARSMHLLRIVYNPKTGEFTSYYSPEIMRMEVTTREFCDWLFIKAMKDNDFNEEEIAVMKEEDK